MAEPGTKSGRLALRAEDRRAPMPLSDVSRLRMLAAEALAAATQMTDANCKRSMVGLAASYERLADHAESREPSGSLPRHHDTSGGLPPKTRT
jgi:hypothetical protein